MTYYDFPASDASSIAVAFETYHTLTHIETHMHRFYEFALVTRGTCTHSFRGVEAPLIVGDVFIIPPHEAHGCMVHPNAGIANCYFFPERLEQLTIYVHEGTFQKPEVPAGLRDVRQQCVNPKFSDFSGEPLFSSSDGEGNCRRIFPVRELFPQCLQGSCRIISAGLFELAARRKSAGISPV